MRVTQRVKKLLSLYEADNPGTKTAIARLLMEGKLAGSGRAMILPVDPAFAKGLIPNPAGADPQYHFQLAVDAGLSAIMGSLNFLDSSADAFAGSMPMILQTSGNAGTGIVREALRLGCVALSCEFDSTSDGEASKNVRMLIEEASAFGLFVMLCTSLESETDAQTAAALGAHVICVKIPAARREAELSAASVTSPLSDSIRHVRQSCASGKRIVVFAGDEIETDTQLFDDVRSIRDGGGHGYMLPTNSLYRPYDPALQILDESVRIYQGKA